MITNGRVIAFDGPDGVGKTLQLEMTASYLQEQGHSVYTTRASGGTPIGELLRSVSLSDTPRSAEVDLYISLAMHTALGQDLAERRKDATCLVDRSPMAVIAYNVVGSQMKDRAKGLEAYAQLLRLWQIDTLIVFTASIETLTERRQQRLGESKSAKTDYFESKGSDFHKRVIDGYQLATSYIHEHPELGISLVEIDANGAVDAIQNEVRAALL
jgi:dTMP kinase